MHSVSASSFIPLVGDVILAVYGANSRNAALLEVYLTARGAAYLEAHPEAVIPPPRRRAGGVLGASPTLLPMIMARDRLQGVRRNSRRMTRSSFGLVQA
ncbi:hypothetical protein BKA70DRAFT_222651 [Coprinopsis sp. MPI-PUGE-AT-0042]|nr:hypothetical protein BKA70DRAFT_222651 [Coprinopsis sp. MPI-PUGE-AT-0042]